jgi:hypothetical protein
MLDLRPGTVTTIASLPTAGRSTFTLNMALHNALQGTCTLYSSSELVADSLTEKTISAMYGIDLRHREVPLGGWDVFKSRTTAEMESTPLLLQQVIDDEPREAFTSGAVYGQGRGHRVALWFLDAIAHFTKFTDHGRDFDRSMQQVRHIAEEAQIPVVLTARAENDAEEEPLALQHIDEAIVRHSDHLLVLHREGIYWQSGPGSKTAIVTRLKPEGGAPAVLKFHPRLCRFSAHAD